MSTSSLRTLYETYLNGSLRSPDLGLPPPPNKVVDGIDSARFHKMCKDASIFNKSFRAQDVDVVFAKHKVASARKMDIRGFRAALEEVARKRGDTNVDALIVTIRQNTINGPSISGTIAESNRFHDDRSTYTGVWRGGADGGPIGPTNIDREKMDLSQLTDRTKKATVRGTPINALIGLGVPAVPSSPAFEYIASPQLQLQQQQQHSRRGSSSSDNAFGDMDLHPLKQVFDTYYFASTRSADLPGVVLPPPPNKVVDGLDSAKFFKLCKDASLFNKSFRTNDVDIVFMSNTVKAGVKKMDWRGFKRAILEVAAKRNESPETMVMQILQETANGPSISGTIAETNRLHDDRGTYTGVWVNRISGDGPIGPTNVDREKLSMSALCDRTKKATVRGTPMNVMVGPGSHLKGVMLGVDNYSVNDNDVPFMQALDDLDLDDHGNFNSTTVLKENTIAGKRNPVEHDKIMTARKGELRRIHAEYSRLSDTARRSSLFPSSAPSSASSSSKEEGIDGTRFVRFVNESLLNMRSTEADLLFAKFKGQKRLSFEGFMLALLEISYKKNVTFMELLDHVANVVDIVGGGGTDSHSASLDSGVNTPQQSQANAPLDLRTLTPGLVAAHAHRASSVDPSTSASQLAAQNMWSGASSMMENNQEQVQMMLQIMPPATPTDGIDLTLPKHSSDELRRVYEEYCLLARSLHDRFTDAIGPKDGIDGARFLKMSTDSNLFDESFRLQDIDFIFVKHAKARKLNFEAFVESIKDICRRKKANLRLLIDQIVAATAAGPSINGTVAEGNRFHDDQ